jgi:hypothetical protein
LVRPEKLAKDDKSGQSESEQEGDHSEITFSFAVQLIRQFMPAIVIVAAASKGQERREKQTEHRQRPFTATVSYRPDRDYR